MRAVPLNEHLVAVMSCNIVAQQVTQLLPECDLVGELRDLLSTQDEMITTYIEGKHAGSKRIDDLLHKLESLQKRNQEIANAISQKQVEKGHKPKH